MKKLLVSVVSVILFGSYSFAQSNIFDHSKFDVLLKSNVDELGLINYNAFKDSKEFNEYLKAVKSVNIIDLSVEDKLAFYINAYNATVIKNVLDHLPIKSPMDVDGFFNKIKHTIAGKEITLDELEHKYALKIEPTLSHFGLVCAAISCPKLLAKAYDGKTVFMQLKENAQLYLNDLQKNKLDREKDILYLSEIFKWFKEFFVKQYGSLKETAIYFINESDAKYLEENEVTIKYMKYNWKLNGQ